MLPIMFRSMAMKADGDAAMENDVAKYYGGVSVGAAPAAAARLW